MSGKKKKKKESILIRSLISTPLLSSKKNIHVTDNLRKIWKTLKN